VKDRKLTWREFYIADEDTLLSVDALLRSWGDSGVKWVVEDTWFITNAPLTSLRRKLRQLYGKSLPRDFTTPLCQEETTDCKNFVTGMGSDGSLYCQEHLSSHLKG